MRAYLVRFTDGSIWRNATVVAPDIVFAGIKAVAIARSIMAQNSFGNCDWTRWRIAIERPEEGRFEQTFPV
jgi:hypothetical protein